MQRLKRIIEERDTRLGRAFDYLIQTLIVISLITFSIETLPNLSSRSLQILNAIEIASVAVFTVEYVLRIFVATHKLRFVFSFYGLIDLLAILPFYIASGIDLRSIRVLRLLRLFRMFKLMRYSRAIQRFRIAFRLVREELILFGVVAMMLVYLASTGIYYFENEAQPDEFASVFDSMWWAVVTLTTVGYGDVYPVTVGGRVFTGMLLVLGLGIVSVPPGIIASALSKARDIEGGDSSRRAAN